MNKIKLTRQIISFGFCILFSLVIFVSCQSTNILTGSTDRNNNAIKAFERGDNLYKRGDLDKAISEFTKAIKIEPEWAEAFIMRGYVHGWNENYKLAMDDYNTASMLDAKYIDLAKAIQSFFNSKYLDAIKIFDAVIQNNIFDMIAYIFRGNSYSFIGEYEKAIADYNEAIKSNPKFYGNFSNRAFSYNKICQFDTAIKDCNQAIKLNPDNFYGYLSRCEAYIGKEDYKNAMTDLIKSIKINHNNNKPHRAYGTINSIYSTIVKTKRITTSPLEGRWTWSGNENSEPMFSELIFFGNVIIGIDNIFHECNGSEFILDERNIIFNNNSVCGYKISGKTLIITDKNNDNYLYTRTGFTKSPLEGIWKTIDTKNEEYYQIEYFLFKDDIIAVKYDYENIYGGSKIIYHNGKFHPTKEYLAYFRDGHEETVEEIDVEYNIQDDGTLKIWTNLEEIILEKIY